jgi:hypothetical protein
MYNTRMFESSWAYVTTRLSTCFIDPIPTPISWLHRPPTMQIPTPNPILGSVGIDAHTLTTIFLASLPT